MNEQLSVNAAVNLLCSENGLRVYPERSSSAETRTKLPATVWGVTALGGGVARSNRAWPVAVMLAVVAGALTVAFSRNVKAANAYEILRFHGNDFEIQRFDSDGALAQHVTMPAYGLKFMTKGEDDDHKIFVRGYVNGKHETFPIGTFLSIPEKEQLIGILRSGQHRHGQPQYAPPAVE